MKNELFSKDEVISFLEELISYGEATTEEEEYYEDYKWSNETSLKINYTYKILVKKMKREWNGR